MALVRNSPGLPMSTDGRGSGISPTLLTNGGDSQVRTEERSGSRNISSRPGVTATMDMVRGALPFLRPLLMAAIVTALILIGLPAVLALGAAAGS